MMFIIVTTAIATTLTTIIMLPDPEVQQRLYFHTIINTIIMNRGITVSLIIVSLYYYYTISMS